MKPTLKRGSRGEDVKDLQKRLALLPDGIFGPLTEEAVKQFQSAHGLSADGIVGPKTWTALVPALASASKTSRFVDEIIIHYTATPQGEEFSNAQIKASHLARGFSDIGYHYVIGLDGEIRPGRSEAIAGAHCTGHNSRSVGVCYVGGCPPRSVKGWQNIGRDTRTEAQKKALLSLIRELKSRYPGATVHGHNEFANKPCPGFNAAKEYADL